MRVIWKYPLEFRTTGGACTVSMPRGARVVHFAFEYRGPLDQGPRAGVPTLWAEVDDQAAPVASEFEIYGTGHPLPDGAVHVATWDAEPFVWHLYDMRYVVRLPAEIEDLPQEARNAYQMLTREGFKFRQVDEHGYKQWFAPDAEPQTTEQMLALATLTEYGLGALAEA